MTIYCSAEDVRDALDIEGTGSDPQILRITGAVSHWIDEYIEARTVAFAPGSDQARYYTRRSTSDNILMLDMPLLSVTTLTNGDASSLSADQYQLWPLNEEMKREIRLKRAFYWRWVDADSMVTVVGRWGYSATVPQPVREAAIIMSAWMQQRYMAGLADAGASLELGRLIYSKAVPEQVKALLEPWREMRFRT